jgi:hypothetical protein
MKVFVDTNVLIDVRAFPKSDLAVLTPQEFLTVGQV